MSAETGPVRLIFNVGARRSGTHWLQRIVTAHSEIASIPAETHLFSDGLAPLFDRFQHGLQGSQVVGKLHVERASLVAAAGQLCDAVFAPFAGDCRYLAERTAGHVEVIELLCEIYPEARVIHIIRDGRQVVQSLLRQSWGPRAVGDAAAEWRRSVEAGLQSGAVLGAERYREVRFEALSAEPRQQVAAIFDWLGVGGKAAGAELEAALAEATLQRNLGTSPSPSSGAGGLDAAALAEFEAVAGDLRHRLGYPEELPTPRRPKRRLPGRLGRDSAPAAPAPGHPGPLLGQHLLDQAVAALRQGRADKLGAILAPGAAIEHRGATADCRLLGGHAAADFVALLADDPTLTAPQIDTVPCPGLPWSGAIMTCRVEGAAVHRAIFVRLEAGLVAELIYHRLD